MRTCSRYSIYTLTCKTHYYNAYIIIIAHIAYIAYIAFTTQTHKHSIKTTNTDIHTPLLHIHTHSRIYITYIPKHTNI